MRNVLALIVCLAVGSSAAADPGDAEKAKQMLERVVVAIHRDQDAAMRTFSAGADGFKDGNIYPFCFRISDGIVLTGQTVKI